MSWLRLHTDILDNPKALQLDARVFKTWMLLLCIAKEGEGRIVVSDALAFRLRLRRAHLDKHIEELVSTGLLDEQADCFQPHDWGEWQYQSDVSTARVQAYRKRSGNVSRNVSETFHETAVKRFRNGPRVQSTENREQSSAAVEIPKQKPEPAAAPAGLDWSGPDAGQEIRALVEQLAETWPNPGSAPQATSAAEREWAKSGSDVGEWCGKVRKSAEGWRSYHQAERSKNPKHFTPQLSRWFYDGDYSRQAPVATTGNKPKPATCPECLNTGWVMLADLPAEAISGVWDSKQLDAWQALNRRRCSCVARAG